MVIVDNRQTAIIGTTRVLIKCGSAGIRECGTEYV